MPSDSDFCYKGIIPYVCATQMLIVPEDVPKLTARDKGSGIAHITFKSQTSDLRAIAASPIKSQQELMDRVLGIWHAQCDALLSDADTMARLQVGYTCC